MMTSSLSIKQQQLLEETCRVEEERVEGMQGDERS